MRRTTKVVAGLAGAAVLLAACGSSSKSSTAGSGSSGSGVKGSSASAAGGMTKLIAAAKKEGTLNVIALPSDWANYGAIEQAFTAKYGIKIHSANPDGSSAQELTALKDEKGTSSEPDVVDVGTSYAYQGSAAGLFAPYQVATWNDIPASEKDANGDFYADYGGVMAIGYNSAKVKVPPTTMSSLLNPMYKHEVGINGDPTSASAAFSAVYAAALANGGSLTNIEPGIKFFQKLSSSGNFVPGTSSATTVENGQTPILIWWDYLQAQEVSSSVPGWKVVIPSDATYAAYYDQAISAYAPHPAAARLWEEFLYSSQGQNLWLEGETQPAELQSMIQAGTVNKAALAKLPKTPANVTLPSEQDLANATKVVATQWSSV